MESEEKLVLALQSPLPNEHELALTTSHILSSLSPEEAEDAEENEKLAGLAEVIGSSPAFLNMLLAHAGFYGDCGLRSLFQQTYQGAFQLDLAGFWEDVSAEETKYLLCECSAKLIEYRMGLLIGLGTESSCEAENPWKNIHRGIMLTKCCEGCTVGGGGNLEKIPCALFANSKIAGRVRLVAEILRNFSFNDGAASTMAQSETMMRFLLVTARCDSRILVGIAFDIISNISKFVKSGLILKDKRNHQRIEYLQKMIAHLVSETIMHSSVPRKLMNCLDAVNEAFKTRDRSNSLYLDKYVVYERAILLLGKPMEAGIHLILSSLELLKSASETGKESCEIIASIPGALQVLLQLVSMDIEELFPGSIVELEKEKEEMPPAEVEECFEEKNEPTSTRSNPRKYKKKETVAKVKLEAKFSPPTSPTTSTKVEEPANAGDTIRTGSRARVPSRKAKESQLAASLKNGKNRKQSLDLIKDIKKFIKNGGNDNEKIIEQVYQKLILNAHEKQMSVKRVQEICGMQRTEAQNLKKSLAYEKRGHPSGENSSVKRWCDGLAMDNGNGSKTAMPPFNPLHPYPCLWSECNLTFKKKDELRWHVVEDHVSRSVGFPIICPWEVKCRGKGCEKLLTKVTLLLHFEYHFKEMEDWVEKELAKKTKTKKPPRKNGLTTKNIFKTQNSPNQEELRSFFVMRKCMCDLEHSKPQIFENNGIVEGPLTKSVRLTAAIILRNVVKYSVKTRKNFLRLQHPLMTVLMEGYDCSSFIAETLHFLNEGDEQEFHPFLYER